MHTVGASSFSSIYLNSWVNFCSTDDSLRTYTVWYLYNVDLSCPFSQHLNVIENPFPAMILMKRAQNTAQGK